VKTKRFIFDTNCLISALLIPTSVNRKALNKIKGNGLLIYSEETIQELDEVIVRSKFDKYVSIEKRLEFIRQFRTQGKLIEIKGNYTYCRDSKDNRFLNLAYDGDAFCIVTGDKDLLTLNPFQNIPILSPADFLSLTL
jgi:uncharacterized protein